MLSCRIVFVSLSFLLHFWGRSLFKIRLWTQYWCYKKNTCLSKRNVFTTAAKESTNPTIIKHLCIRIRLTCRSHYMQVWAPCLQLQMSKSPFVCLKWEKETFSSISFISVAWAIGSMDYDNIQIQFISEIFECGDIGKKYCWWNRPTSTNG